MGLSSEITVSAASRAARREASLAASGRRCEKAEGQFHDGGNGGIGMDPLFEIPGDPPNRLMRLAAERHVLGREVLVPHR